MHWAFLRTIACLLSCVLYPKGARKAHFFGVKTRHYACLTVRFSACSRHTLGVNVLDPFACFARRDGPPGWLQEPQLTASRFLQPLCYNVLQCTRKGCSRAQSTSFSTTRAVHFRASGYPEPTHRKISLAARKDPARRGAAHGDPP